MSNEIDKQSNELFLVIAEENVEFDIALRVAVGLANNNNARVGVFYTASDTNFHQWAGVQDQIRNEIRQEAEKFVWKIAKKINDFHDKMPVIYIEIGDKYDKLLKTIKEDNNISLLIMGVGKNKDCTSFTQKIIAKIKIPILTINVDTKPEDIIKLFRK